MGTWVPYCSFANKNVKKKLEKINDRVILITKTFLNSQIKIFELMYGLYNYFFRKYEFPFQKQC